jgi:hypothetical protein
MLYLLWGILMLFSHRFILWSACACLVACTQSYTESSSYEMPLTKQRQRVTFLQKKLQMAEKERSRTEEEVERLGEELSLAKLSLISKLVEECSREIEHNPKKWSGVQAGDLFLKERETLYELIQTSSYSFEAQLVLDKILQIITNLSDQGR